jgi:[acyl-carrier-protein] S-malonyltransferase
MRAFVFPGQGSQAVGMGRELAAAFGAARQVFEEVDEALGERLSRLIFEGPEADLTLTENAQPALMTVSLAVVRVLEAEGGVRFGRHVAYVAGHSLGEYSALAASGVLALADTARLLRRRGQAMQAAVPVGTGAMAALLGAELDQARRIAAAAAEAEVCEVANDNAAGQVVLSGHRGAVERATRLAAEEGVRKAIMLPVSAPFHCALMRPAAEVMAEALARTAFAPPTVPHLANVTAAPVHEPSRARELLIEQVTAMVRWRESVLALKALGVEIVVELGAGRVLSGLIKRIDRDLGTLAVLTPAEVESFLKTL